MGTSMPWERQDPLTQALYRVRMRGAFYSWTVASGRGAVAMPQIADTLSFHMVARGRAFLEVDGREPVRLGAGHLALVPRGIGHRVSTAPAAPLLGQADELPQTMLGDSFSILRVGDPGDEELLAVLCGVVAFDAPAVQDLLAVLPPIVQVDSARHPMMASLLALLAEELRDPRPGGDAVATRLADVLVIQTVRAWLWTSPRPPAGGWLPCATRASDRPSRRCTATPGTSGRWRAGGPGRDVALLVRGAVHRRRGHATHDLRGRLAHAPRPRDADRRVVGGGCRRGPGVQARRRRSAAPSPGSPGRRPAGSAAPRPERPALAATPRPWVLGGSVGAMATTADLLLDSLERVRETAHWVLDDTPEHLLATPPAPGAQHRRVAGLAPHPRCSTSRSPRSSATTRCGRRVAGASASPCRCRPTPTATA